MKLSDKTYREFQALILKSEGKALENEIFPGCRIKDSEGRKGYLNYYLGKDMWEWLASPLPARWITNINNLEILGQNITLERVMVALGSQCMNMAINEDGFFMGSKPLDSYESLGFRWDFYLPAHLQEEEVILKLKEILR